MRAFIMLLLLACSGREPAPPAPRELARVEPDEPAPAPTPWPIDLESLTSSAEHFQSPAQCEADLQGRLPVEIAEVLADLAYDTAVVDVCIALEAAKLGDVSRCDALSVRAVQEGCRRRVAYMTGDADACPSARGIEGRDPMCLAWATRSPSLCDGVKSSDQRTCRAVLANDAEGCHGESCEGLVARYGEVVQGNERRQRHGSDASITMHHETEETTREFEGELSRGVFLEAAGCGYRLQLDIGRPFQEGMRISIEATLDRELSAQTIITRLSQATTGMPQPLRDATFELSGEASRGAALQGTLEGKIRVGSQEVPVTVELQTWIRDLDPLSEACP